MDEVRGDPLATGRPEPPAVGREPGEEQPHSTRDAIAVLALVLAAVAPILRSIRKPR